MKVLVTGATGFVGSRVVRRLIRDGDDVAMLVRQGSSRRRLADLSDCIHVMEGDLADPDGWRDALSRWQPEACIHAAWYAEPGKYLDSTENLNSLRQSLDLLEEAAVAGCRHVLGVGTCFEYQMASTPLREDSPTRPATLYAACKLAFDLVARQRLAQLDVGFAWSRLFYIYGPDEDERRLVPAAIRSLTAGREFPSTAGEQVRDYLHVDDVAAALCAISRGGLKGEFNVCSGSPVTIAGLMQSLGDLLGRSDLIRLGAYPYRQWEPMYVCGDSERLRTQSGWSPQYSLRDGLADTIASWRRAH